jgi:hypothetical protein
LDDGDPIAQFLGDLEEMGGMNTVPPWATYSERKSLSFLW